jgi:hypothetical protein
MVQYDLIIVGYGPVGAICANILVTKSTQNNIEISTKIDIKINYQTDFTNKIIRLFFVFHLF